MQGNRQDVFTEELFKVTRGDAFGHLHAALIHKHTLYNPGSPVVDPLEPLGMPNIMFILNLATQKYPYWIRRLDNTRSTTRFMNK